MWSHLYLKLTLFSADGWCCYTTIWIDKLFQKKGYCKVTLPGLSAMHYAALNNEMPFVYVLSLCVTSCEVKNLVVQVVYFSWLPNFFSWFHFFFSWSFYCAALSEMPFLYVLSLWVTSCKVKILVVPSYIFSLTAPTFFYLSYIIVDTDVWNLPGSIKEHARRKNWLLEAMTWNESIEVR